MLKTCNIKGTINDNFSNILSRPFLSVYPDTKLFELIPFFAIGPDIYADGLVVTSKNIIQDDNENFNNKKDKIFKESRAELSGEFIKGRISSKHLLLIIIDLLSQRKFAFSLYNLTAAEIMDVLTEEHMIESDSTVSKVLDIFKKTGFAFLPIVKKINYDNLNSYKMLSYLTVRDFLQFFLKKKKGQRNFAIDNSCLKEIIDIPIKDVSSKLISVSKNSLFVDVINMMLSNKIRNIGILNNNSKLIGILNDRNILQLIVRSKDRFTSSTHESNNLARHSKLNAQVREFKECTLEDLEVLNNFKIPRMFEIKEDISISKAANHLKNLKHSYLILEGKDRIVTPWDIVMKTLT
ncbi:MAG TPA: CBS domain-containing protein [Nitrososphaeraceae archaeon]|jgi:CBS domain-containing protein|nr:CBS domain-containing protein [Nitrososphaeraceae archaeon]